MLTNPLFYLIVFIGILLITEAIGRLLGYKPFNPTVKIKSFTPELCLEPDPNAGYRLKTGIYTTLYQSGYSFKTEHDVTGNRVVGAVPTVFKNTSVKKISVYGDSFLYGFGINNQDTFCWKLQQLYPGLIINRTVMGYGAVSYLQRIKSDFQIEPGPDLALVQFSSYDLPKQVLSKETERNMSSNSPMLKHFSYPYVKKISPELLIDYRFLGKKKYRLSKMSGLYNKFETAAMAKELSMINIEEVCYGIYDAIINLCHQYRVIPVIAILTNDNISSKMMQYLNTKGVDWLDLSLDFKNPLYNSLPFDNHPSPLAHSIFADRVNGYLLSRFPFPGNPTDSI